MKKTVQIIIAAILAFIGTISNANSQSFNCLWAQASKQSASSSTTSLLNDVYAMATDSKGNTYVTGTFSTDSIVFGSITLLRASASKTNSDFFIAKYNSSGTVLWAKGAGGNGANTRGWSGAGQDNITSGTGLAVDNAGNVYATGYFQSDSIVLGNTTLNTEFGTISSNSNIFIVKYDSLGNEIWAKEAGQLDNGITSAGITTDGKGNVYVTGNYNLNSQVSSTVIGGITLQGNGFVIAKFNSSGNIIWAKTAVGGLTDYSSCAGTGITSDRNGNIVVIGTYFGDSTAFGGGVTLQNSLGGVNSQMFVVKYDSLGNTIWAQNYDIGIRGQGFNGVTIGGVNGLTADAHGNLYVTGGFYNSTATFGSITLINNANGGFDNMFIVKYNPSGTVLWAKSATETAGDFDAEGLGVSTDVNGNVFVTGTFEDNTITFGNKILSGSSAQTIFVAKYDSLGNVLGAMAAGGGGYQIDDGVGINTDNNGSFYVTGIFYDTLAFGNKQMSSGQQQGIFVAKFDGTPSGIMESQPSNPEISIYPNPGSGNFTLQLQNVKQNMQVEVFDVLGRNVYEANLSSTTTKINLSSQPKGIYLYRINTEDGLFISSGKVLIE